MKRGLHAAVTLVTLVVHVPLTVPDVGGAANVPCFTDRRSYPSRAVSPALMSAYERTFHKIGDVSFRYGFGSWSVPGTGGTRVELEPIDHVVVRAPAGTVRDLLPHLLRRMQRELHQKEMFAEIYGDGDASLGTQRRNISVTVPLESATYERLRAVHAIFDDRDSGASQFDVPQGVRIASSVPLRDVPRIEGELRAANIPFAGAPSTVVTADAAPCPTTSAARSPVRPRR